MITIAEHWELIASLLVSVCLSVALILMNQRFKQQARRQAQQQQVLEQQIDALAQQLAVINKGTLGMGRRLMTTEKRLNQTMERQDSLENKESEQLSFKQAAKLFERGLEMDNVIEKVGITKTEAKLVDMIQQKQIAELEED